MQRNYGIDLLRIVLIFMVCILHTLGQGGVLASCEVGTLNYNVYYLLEIVSYCAVDGFAIISGYVAADKFKKYEKLVEMWFQVFYYSAIISIIFWLCNLGVTKWELVSGVFPVTFNYFWYFSAFCIVFLVSPILNLFLFRIDEKIAKMLLVSIIVVFSIIGFLQDCFYLNSGYSAIWLVALYCLGILAKRGKIFEKKKTVVLVSLWILCIVTTWVLYISGRFTIMLSYVSPLVLVSGLLMVIIFSRFNFKGTIISKISPLVFGIYLFQMNKVIWRYLEGAFSFVASRNVIFGMGYVLGGATLIFGSGLIVEYIRVKLSKFLRIPQLSRKIVTSVKWMLEKVTVLLD